MKNNTCFVSTWFNGQNSPIKKLIKQFSEKNGRVFAVESELSQPEDVAISSNGKAIVVADTGKRNGLATFCVILKGPR